MTEELNTQLRARGYPGRAALVILDARSGELLHAENADEPMPAASTIKVPILVRALERCQHGELHLGERLTMRAEDRVTGAGVLQELEPGLTPTLQDLLTLMIVVSDNTATNMVIEHVGLSDLKHWLAAQMPSSRLVGKLQLPEHLRNAAQQRGERNATTAHEQAHLLARLYRGELLDAAHTQLALSILERQQYRDILARHAPRGDSGELLYPVLSKSGELSGVHHDVGLLLFPRPLSVALLSSGGSDPREHPGNHDVQLLAETLWPLLYRAGFGP
ncbi:serine hydrolase [Deinococcus ruber]|uniref:Serine hydrolase n=1 Tax=Deinococcus ruber TaxID=1848197 RepID=A0A918CJS9_9DEIO|nr:serine hydrolase [Deinococcus ruber]GGR27836.1 serine hydrolase [Deinococcus ruber]